jgi:outer membrane cobalamin receptor
VAASAYAAVFGSVRGIVHDPDHRPVAGARVSLRAATSDWIKTTETNAEGEFAFAAAPIGRYTVSVMREGFAPAEQNITVTADSAPVLHFPLGLATLAQSVETSETAEALRPESAAAMTLLSRTEIERTPGADRTNSLAMITDYVPGAYITHDQLHIRGGHQVSWLIDGVPVPNTNIASNVGPQFDPKDADNIEVERGGYSAGYGDRTYGVFNVAPRTGFERNNEAELVASYGSFHQTNDQLSFGSHTEKFAYYASLSGYRADLGLETPAPAVLHDRAAGLGVFNTLVYNAGPSDQLRLVTSLRGDDYQVPNTPEQAAASVDDTERERDAFVNFSWVHTAGPGVLLTVSPFYHYNRSDYLGETRDRHASAYAGGQASVSALSRKHNARAGVYAFAQRDDSRVALPPLELRQALGGNLEAAYLEDQFKATAWFTVTAGVRLTHFAGALSENAASPRLGLALRIPRWNWILRGYYGRFYQAPPLSTVDGPLLERAAEEGFAFLPLHGERDEQRQLGLTIPLRGWLFDSDAFETRARNYFDHNALGSSNVFFPVTIDRARIRGWEVTVRSPRILRRAEVRLAYSRQTAEGEGGISGGLTDFAPPEGRFLLDHDQRHTLNAGFELNLPSRVWLAGNVYYGSGFADEGGPSHLPGHTTVDLMVGRRMGERWSVSVNALNAANRSYLLDNSLTFGGTHYAEPRQLYAQVRYSFRY